MMTDNSVDILKDNTDDVISKLIESQDAEEIKRLTQLFNVNQMKKDAIRIVKLNQVSERVEKYPDLFSNADLLNYVNTIQQTITKSNQTISNINQIPLIQLNQQNNIVQVSDDILTRESREKILNVVKQFLDNPVDSGKIVNVAREDVVYYDDKEDK